MVGGKWLILNPFRFDSYGKSFIYLDWIYCIKSHKNFNNCHCLGLHVVGSKNNDSLVNESEKVVVVATKESVRIDFPWSKNVCWLNCWEAWILPWVTAGGYTSQLRPMGPYPTCLPTSTSSVCPRGITPVGPRVNSSSLPGQPLRHLETFRPNYLHCWSGSHLLDSLKSFLICKALISWHLIRLMVIFPSPRRLQ